MSLQTIGLMKEALDKEGLKPHLMIQPVCYHAPDSNGNGFQHLPEAPFGKLVFFSIHSTAVVLMTTVTLANITSPQGNLGIDICLVRSIIPVGVQYDVKQVIT